MPLDPPSLPDRWRALTSRERLFLAVGSGAILLFLLFMLLPSTEEAPPVEIAQAPPPAAVTPPPQAYVPPPPAPPAASASALLLRGVLGSGAIIAFPTGGERLVPVGRELLPGLTLKAVGVHHVILTSGGGDLRLELGKAGAIPVQAGAPSAPAASEAAAVQQQQSDTLDYRLGLQRVSADGRDGGYRVKPGARLPHLDRAGLKPGDVIVGVNGSLFDEERMMELSWQIENSPRVEFEVLRGGRRIKLATSRAK